MLKTLACSLCFYISLVFSNAHCVLSQCNTWLRLLHLLYDIDDMHTKQENKLLFLCFIL